MFNGSGTDDIASRRRRVRLDGRSAAAVAIRRRIKGYKTALRRGAKRYRALCKEAARQLGCKPTDEVALHVGVLRLARESFLGRMVDGLEIDPAVLVRLDG
jgi:hypothetical protein